MTAERTLVLLRHAKSAWPDGVADEDRPLADRGRRDAPAAGWWLAQHRPDIDLVVCSPALRTRQTWALVAAELVGTPVFRVDSRCYEASARGLLSVVRELPDDVATVLLVGHSPGLAVLVHTLSGADVQLKTSAVVVLRGQGDWAGAGPKWATLDASETPRGG
jgi:phosphohistidine phosphatase